MKIIPILPLRMRLFLPILIFIIPGFIFAVFRLDNQRQREKDYILNTATRLARIIAIQEVDLIEATREFLIGVSHEPIVTYGKLQECQKFLSVLMDQLGRYTNIAIADPEGNITCSVIPYSGQINVADRGYFRTVMKTGNFSVGEYQIGRIVGHPTINFGYPIVSENGRKLGVVFVAFDLKRLEDFEKRVVLTLPEGSTLTKIDRNGRVLVQYTNEHDAKGHPVCELSHILGKVTRGQGIVWTSDSIGTTYLNAYSQIDSKLFPTGISLILSISEERAFYVPNHTFYSHLYFLSILGFLFLLVGAIANEFYIVRGLFTIRRATLRLKGGNLNTRAEQVHGLIEVRELASTFNDMAGMIEQRESERKQAEKELQFKNTILSAQQEASIDGILVVDKDSNIVLYNRRFVEMWDLPPELVKNKADDPILMFCIKKVADHQSFIERVQYLYKHKQETSQEEIDLKDGRIFERYTTPMIGPEDKYYGRIWYFHDITERKKAEKALQDSERKYRIVADNTYSWEFWSDQAGNYIYCSPSCFRVSGYTASEFIENPGVMPEIVHPDFLTTYFEHLNRVSIDRKSESLQIKIIHKNGSERWIEHLCQPVFDADGNYQGQRGTNFDITERKESERKILSAIISTEESERKKFSQELHDGLGPTLSTVKLYFQWLSETSDVEKQKSITKIGLQNIEDAIETTREISNSLSPRTLNNMGLVPALKFLIHRINETHKLSINFTYDSERRYNSQIEITLYRIISELMNNTIKHAMAHLITINLSHNYNKNQLELLYADDGIGFNLNNVIENKIGMGLENMMQRVATLNGLINFNTDEGKSLMVKIELPIIFETQE